MKQLRIESVTPYKDTRIKVSFSNGIIANINLSDFVSEFASLRPLLNDKELFSKATVGEWGWDIHWTNDIEIHVDTLWRLYLEQNKHLMTPADMCLWRKNFGLSQVKAAEVLGLSKRTLAYYESGAHQIPETVRLACKGAELEINIRH